MEGRFKSQALLDEAGLLTVMAYVDLNPIRAGIAATPEDSAFTSIQQRIRERSAKQRLGSSVPLKPLTTRKQTQAAIGYELVDYLQLVDWNGRSIRKDKRGAIDARLPPILSRLAIDSEAWRLAMQPGGNVFGRAMGRVDSLRLHANTLGQSWVRGLKRAERIFT